MSLRIAINGYGRIGRQILRAVYENGLNKQLKIVAVNASGGLQTNAHLTQYDTTHGLFPHKVGYEEDCLVVDGDKIPFYSTRDPAKLPWKELEVDLVMECTGVFTNKTKCQAHLEAGAKKVLISAPAAREEVDATIVYGVNHQVLTSDMVVVSNGSCTTNCLAPLVKPLHNELGILKGLMTTVHAFTNDQVLVDVRHKDLRRARSAVANLIPTKTGAAQALGLVLPELEGRLEGFAIRVPTMNVSLVDLTFHAAKSTTVQEVNDIMKQASENELKGVLGYNTLPLVSSDFNHRHEASIFDETLTKVIEGDLVKVLAWYDNEWGFSCQMLNTARAMFDLSFRLI
ncbi:MAG: type I glyceraldehyde-3-phosphate dehydrogenase [Neisseriaceae bacterium]